mgnify:FL=1
MAMVVVVVAKKKKQCSTDFHLSITTYRALVSSLGSIQKDFCLPESGTVITFFIFIFFFSFYFGQISKVEMFFSLLFEASEVERKILSFGSDIGGRDKEKPLSFKSSEKETVFLFRHKRERRINSLSAQEWKVERKKLSFCLGMEGCYDFNS